MPDYSLNDPRGWCGDPRRGAALGRPTVHDADSNFTGRIYLSRIRLNQGGYDKNGTYFGTGDPLYWYADEEGLIDGMLRATARLTAREMVLKRYSKAKIKR